MEAVISDRGIAVSNTVTISVTTSSQSQPLTNISDVVVCQNTGSTLCFVRLGGPNITASTSDFPLQPGGIVSLDQSGYTYIAAICGTGSTTFYASVCSGLLVLS